MDILCVGDVVGEAGVNYFCDKLSLLKHQYNIDLVIVNGENSDKHGVGISRAEVETLFRHADVITTGNHCFRRADENLFAEYSNLLYPANFPYSADNAGYCDIDTGRFGIVRVINLMGVAWMEALDNPFSKVDKILQNPGARFTVVDFHAESTAEKKAMAFYLDGRVSALFGTHTHVQTADEQILPKGTGYITDVGMTGPELSVIGVEPGLAIEKQRTHRPVRFKVAQTPAAMNCVLFSLDNSTGLCTHVQRINI